MFPSLHDDVDRLLQESGLAFTFHDADEEHCAEDYDTRIMGRFSCHNPSCAARGWSSKVIPITIRMYDGQKYNARVYHQRCKSCERPAKPRVDGSYAERIAYRLKKWSNVEVDEPFFNKTDNLRPHLKRLCEGCKVGRCLYRGWDGDV